MSCGSSQGMAFLLLVGRYYFGSTGPPAACQAANPPTQGKSGATFRPSRHDVEARPGLRILPTTRKHCRGDRFALQTIRLSPPDCSADLGRNFGPESANAIMSD